MNSPNHKTTQLQTMLWIPGGKPQNHKTTNSFVESRESRVRSSKTMINYQNPCFFVARDLDHRKSFDFCAGSWIIQIYFFLMIRILVMCGHNFLCFWIIEKPMIFAPGAESIKKALFFRDSDVDYCGHKTVCVFFVLWSQSFLRFCECFVGF